MDDDHINPEMLTRCSCGICLEFFDSTSNIPRVLFCGHSTCQKCIVKLLDGSKNIKCPGCQQFSLVPDVTALVINKSLIDIADFVRDCKKRSDETSFSCVQCSVNLESKDVGVCITPTCEQGRLHLCFKCAIVKHEGHKIVLLEQFTSLLHEECKSQLEQIKEDAEKIMEEVMNRSEKTSETMRRVCTKLIAENRFNFIIKKSENIFSDDESVILTEIARDLMKPFTDACQRWNSALQTIDKEIEELFGEDDETKGRKVPERKDPTDEDTFDVVERLPLIPPL